MKKFLLTILFMASTQATAAQERGGGWGTVCRDSKGAVISIALRDYVEAAKTTTLQLDLGPGKTYQEKLGYVVNRLQKIDPIFAKYIEGEVAAFTNNAAFITDYEIRKIFDGNSPIEPTGNCKEEMLAANKPQPLPFEKKYLFNDSLWKDKAMSEETKAGVVLHEVVYAYVRDMNDTSDSTRYYVSVISSQEMAGLTPLGYVKILSNLGWSLDNGLWSRRDRFSIFHEGGTYSPNTLRFYNSGKWYFGNLLSPAMLVTPLGVLNLKDVVAYSEEGYINSGILAQPYTLPVGNFQMAIPEGVKFNLNKDKRINVLTSGTVGSEFQIDGAYTVDGRPIKLSGYGHEVNVCKNGKLAWQCPITDQP